MPPLFLKERPAWVRCNLNRASREEILASLKAQRATARPVEGFEAMLALSGYDYLEGLEAFQKGWIQVQDVSSAFSGGTGCRRKKTAMSWMYALPLVERAFIWRISYRGPACVEARDLTYQKAALIEENWPAVWGQSM